MSKVVVLHSGGLDSTVLLYQQISIVGAKNVFSFSVDYGQRHSKELDYAHYLCKEIGVERFVFSLDYKALKANNSLTGQLPVPEGHYEDKSMQATVAPNRNMLLLSCAATFAISKRAQAILYGAHTGDHAIYPDCRPEFVRAMQSAISLCHYTPLFLNAPFIGLSKAKIVKLGASLGVPFGHTWSCYKGGDIHCGKCGTCVERKEAFKLAEIIDPTIYEEESIKEKTEELPMAPQDENENENEDEGEKI